MVDDDMNYLVKAMIKGETNISIDSSQAGFSADGAGESALPAEESPSAGSANSENFTRK